MSNGILEADHTNRNITIFVSVLLISAGFTAFFFIKNHGCDEYVENLKTCTPSVCAQRVMGFESKYMTHKPATLRREILGMEKDQFFDTSTCNVIEIDDMEKNEPVTCKYSDKTREEVVKRAAILFGTAPLASDPHHTIEDKQVSSIRGRNMTFAAKHTKIKL